MSFRNFAFLFALVAIPFVSACKGDDTDVVDTDTDVVDTDTDVA